MQCAGPPLAATCFQSIIAVFLSRFLPATKPRPWNCTCSCCCCCWESYFVFLDPSTIERNFKKQKCIYDETRSYENIQLVSDKLSNFIKPFEHSLFLFFFTARNVASAVVISFPSRVFLVTQVRPSGGAFYSPLSFAAQVSREQFSAVTSIATVLALFFQARRLLLRRST